MSVHSPSAQLAVLYEHPQWFQPLFAALERPGLTYAPIELKGHGFDPSSRDVRAPLILSRAAKSSEGDIQRVAGLPAKPRASAR